MTTSSDSPIRLVRSIPGGSLASPHPSGEFNPRLYAEFLNDHNGADGITAFSEIIHSANVAAGWWTDIETGQPKQRNIPELLCLVHSEISEALEGHRKGLQDDHLPHRPSIEVELADAMIRIWDLAGALQLDLGGAVMEKLAYNFNRADHKIENRLKADGKKI